MEQTWKILVVDDTPQNIKVLDAHPQSPRLHGGRCQLRR